MHRKTLATGILLLFIGSILSPVAFGFNVEESENETFPDDTDYASNPYTSDSTLSETVIISEYLNPQPTVVLDNGLMNSPWPMKCHDLHHTSRSPYNADDGDGLEKWRFYLDRWMESSTVIDNDGMIYFGYFNYYLFAIYPNATLKWKYKTGAQIWSTPALAEDGTIYVASWDCKLHAVNPNGTRKWATGLGGVGTGSPAISSDGTIYTVTMGEAPSGHSLVAVYPNGTIRWKYLTGDDMTSHPAIADDGTIYVGSLDSYFYAVNPDGTLKWRFKTGDWVKSHPAIADDGTIYINSFDNYLYALYPNGTMKWRIDDCGNAGSPALGSDGMIYTGNNHLYGIYPNGTIKWSIPLDLGHSSPALSADDILYVGIGKSIVAVNAADGAKLWQKKIANNWVESSPIIGPDGTVYIGSSSDKMIDEGYYLSLGYLHAFGPVSTNSLPNTPSINGKTKGEAGKPQYYTLNAVDPDNNPVSFYIDWGDGSYTNWSGGGKPSQQEMNACASGETVYFEHTYAEKGIYTIQAKAHDTLGEESGWATLEVEMPLTQSYPVLNWLMNRFPLLARILEVFTKDNTPILEMQTPSFLPETHQEQYDFMRMTYNDFKQHDTYIDSHSQNLLGGLE